MFFLANILTDILGGTPDPGLGGGHAEAEERGGRNHLLGLGAAWIH